MFWLVINVAFSIQPLVNESHHNVVWILNKKLVKVVVRYLHPLHASSQGDTPAEFKLIRLAATQDGEIRRLTAGSGLRQTQISWNDFDWMFPYIWVVFQFVRRKLWPMFYQYRQVDTTFKSCLWDMWTIG